MRVDLLFSGALPRQLAAPAQRQNVDADLDASHPVVSSRSCNGCPVFFPVAIGADAGTKLRLCRSQGGPLRRLRLPQRRQIRPRLCGRGYLLFQRRPVECMRLNRLQFGCLELRSTHRLAQLGPRQFQVSLGRNQFFFADCHIYLGRHPVRLDRQAGLDVVLNRCQQRRGSVLLMMGDVDFPLRVEHRLVRPDNVVDNLLVHRLGG